MARKKLTVKPVPLKKVAPREPLKTIDWNSEKTRSSLLSHTDIPEDGIIIEGVHISKAYALYIKRWLDVNKIGSS